MSDEEDNDDNQKELEFRSKSFPLLTANLLPIKSVKIVQKEYPRVIFFCSYANTFLSYISTHTLQDILYISFFPGEFFLFPVIAMFNVLRKAIVISKSFFFLTGFSSFLYLSPV